MNWLRNMSVTTKLIAGFVTVIALTMILGVFSINQLAKVNGTATEMAGNWLPSVQALGDLNVKFNVYRIGQYRLCAADNNADITKVQGMLDQRIGELKAVEQTYNKLISTSEEKQNFEQYTSTMKKYLEIQDQLVALMLKNETKEANALLRGQSLDLYYQLQEQINKLIEINDSGAKEANKRGDALYASARTLLIGVMLACALIGMTIAMIIGRAISKPLALIVKRAQEIKDGDLRGEDIPVRSTDEIGTLTQAINHMGDSLRNLIVEVTSATREVAGAATEIAASSEQMAAGMTQQTDQVTQISSAVEEMSSSVIEVARKSSNAADNAMKAGAVAEQGGQVVGSTIDGMHAISEAVRSSSDSVTALGKRGEQIGTIIEVINDIADQTNLLALNAAIEAARAGEHGRGFAVVADEVRKLADRTTKATEEIALSITAIQDETTQAVGRMNTGTDQVKTGVERATAAGESLKQIVTQARDVADMIRSIAAAAEQQSAASEQISHSVETISAVTRQSAEGAGQAAAAATQLSGKAEHLKRVVGQFRVREERMLMRSAA